MTEAEMCNAWRAVQVHDHIFFLGIIEKKGDTNSRCIRYALQNYNYTVLVRCAGRNSVLRDLCVLVTDGRYARVARMCGRIWVLEECGDALSSTYGEQKWVILYTDVLLLFIARSDFVLVWKNDHWFEYDFFDLWFTEDAKIRDIVLYIEISDCSLYWLTYSSSSSLIRWPVQSL